MDKKHAAGMCNLRNKKQEGKIKTMRLDKFLKVSRLIKRRTVANEACDAGRVMVNGKPAKASVNVKVGDVIEIAFGTKSVKVRVLDLQDTTKKEEAKDLFEYVSYSTISCSVNSFTIIGTSFNPASFAARHLLSPAIIS